jgi:hypothetical protein
MTFPTLISASALALGAAFLAFPSHGFAASTDAANAVTKACSTKYEAAKKANALGGKTWSQYLHDCSGSMSGGGMAPSKTPAPAGKSPTSAPAPKPAQTEAMATTSPLFAVAAATTTTTTPNAQQPKPREMGFRQRVHECSAQYKADKASGKLPAGQKWAQYWSSCNVRMKTQ